MTTGIFNSLVRFIVRAVPLLFVLSSVWVVVTWRQTTLSFAYLMAYVATGIICGALVIAVFVKNSSSLLGVLCWIIFISAPTLLHGFVFTNIDGKALGLATLSYEYMSVVFATILGLLSIFRSRISKRIALAMPNTRLERTRLE
jgi:hypothetical protein